jgi:hypothetical protein
MEIDAFWAHIDPGDEGAQDAAWFSGRELAP